jgi:hypothetical protein
LERLEIKESEDLMKTKALWILEDKEELEDQLLEEEEDPIKEAYNREDKGIKGRDNRQEEEIKEETQVESSKESRIKHQRRSVQLEILFPRTSRFQPELSLKHFR